MFAIIATFLSLLKIAILDKFIMSHRNHLLRLILYEKLQNSWDEKIQL